MEDAMAIRELALYCVLAGSTPTIAAEPLPAPEAWTPTSRAAQAVTGRATFTATQLTFQNGLSLTLVSGGQMLFRSEPKKKKVMADLYRVTSPDDPVLENGTKLCKGKPVAYVIMWKSEKSAKEIDPRALAFFSGPRFDLGSPDDCGRYIYDSGKP
jgi:hypothetical protein